MGAEVDGLRGTVSAPLDKKLEVAFFAIWMMGRGTTATKVRLMVLGRLVRCFEFRRPLMCLLSAVWPRGNLQVRRPLSPSGIQELLRCIAMLPMAGTDLRAQVSSMVTSSDASEAGGGLCASGGLTDEGHTMLNQLASPAYRRDRMLPFAAQGAMESRKNRRPPHCGGVTLRWHCCPYGGLMQAAVQGCGLRFIRNRCKLQAACAATLAWSHRVGQCGEDQPRCLGQPQ